VHAGLFLASVCLFWFSSQGGQGVRERKNTRFTGALLSVAPTRTRAHPLSPLPSHEPAHVDRDTNPSRSSRGRRRKRLRPARRLPRIRSPTPPRAGAEREVRASPWRPHPALPSRVHRPPPPPRWSSAARATWSRACCTPPLSPSLSLSLSLHGTKPSRAAAPHLEEIAEGTLPHPSTQDTLPHPSTLSHSLAHACTGLATDRSAWHSLGTCRALPRIFEEVA
jgi:hypothetical protein